MTRKKPSFLPKYATIGTVMIALLFMILSILAMGRWMEEHWYTPKSESPIEERIEAGQHVLLSISQQALDEMRKYNESEQEKQDLKLQLALAQKDLKDLTARSESSRMKLEHPRQTEPTESTDCALRGRKGSQVTQVTTPAGCCAQPALSINKPTKAHPTKARGALFHRKQVFGWGTGGDCWSTQEWDRGL